ncbi:hypothetical protein IAD21_02158 [Abditibacteriota bacterium]|nr:hypothetical protein IAD21_02158 [Abditibacteriota bacterium]
MTSPYLRDERAGDADAVRHVLQEAFRNHPHSSGRESLLVDALRESKALDVALVVEVDGIVVGHIAFSKVTIAGTFCGWYGLGPIAVLPAYQSRGIGSTLIREGLERLQSQGAAGCVVLGEPGYYGRFGFKVRPGLELEGVPVEYFLAMSFDGSEPQGLVKYRPEFAE